MYFNVCLIKQKSYIYIYKGAILDEKEKLFFDCKEKTWNIFTRGSLWWKVF